MAEFEKTSIDETINNFIKYTQGKKYKTIYADPPWQFQNRTGKVAPEHKRLNRYPTMKLEDIMKLPVGDVADEKSHLYLWVPNALLPEGLQVMEAWGFEYKTNLIWEKTRKDGEPDGRGVGFYFRNVTEILLFGIKGRRWEENYPSKIATLFNEYWVYPAESEKPKNASTVEMGCYWK